MSALNGTPYGIEDLPPLKIKQGAQWQETFLVEGNLTTGQLVGYVARIKTDLSQGEGERFVEFTFLNINFGDFDIDTDDPLIGFTTFDVVLLKEDTEAIPLTPVKQSASPKAGKDYWEFDIEYNQPNGQPINLITGIVYVEGQC